MKRILLAIPLLVAAGACTHKNNSEKMEYTSGVVHVGTVVGFNRDSKPRSYMPKATAFRMNGDYARNVAITLGADGNPVYFPAPGDISEASAPLDLGNGWWLNRQGISGKSVFTTYTFPEYAALKKAPTQAELKKSVIPGSGIIEMVELPYTINEAVQHIDSVKSLLADGKGFGQ